MKATEVDKVAKDKFLKNIEIHLNHLQKLVVQLRTGLTNVFRQLDQMKIDILPIIKKEKEFLRLIDKSISPIFDEFQQSFQDLPFKMQELLILLGTEGWYLDLEMTPSELFEISQALTKKNIREVENVLAEYFEERLDNIEKSILKKFPNRKKIIKAAFNAHRRQEYELSIPVLLSQTDGICKEIANEYLFITKKKNKNKKPQTAIYVEKIASDTLLKAILSPLGQTLPINVSESERKKGFNKLNRHMVLHGESLDYGTKTNSLKAISLINYVAQVLKEGADNS